MADKIGSLIVSLQADLARFDTDLKRATSMAEGAMGKIESAAAGAMKALGAIGVGLSVAGFAAMARQVIDSAAALDDLAEKTGASVESLSKFAGVARVTGQDMGAVEQAMGKLSKSIVEAQDGSSNAARAFAAFGVSIKNADGSLKNSGDLMAEIAVAQQNFADGAGKAAAMQELLGKAGAENIPFMNDYVRLSGEITETTAAQAAEAETLKIQIGLLGENFHRLVREALLPLLPALNQMITYLSEGATKGAAFSAIGTVISGAFKGLVTAGIAVVEVFKQVGIAIGSVVGAIVSVAQGEFARAWEILKMGGTDMVASIKASVGAIADIWGSDVTPAINSVTTATEKAGVAFSTTAKSAAKLKEEVLKLGAYMKQIEAPSVRFKELADASDRWAASMADTSRALERQAREMGLTRQQVLALELAELDAIETEGVLGVAQEELTRQINRRREAINNLIGKLNELEASDAAANAARKASEDWQRTADSIQNSLTDALLRGFESGADFAKNFRDTLVNMFKTLILRPVIQAIVAPLAGGLGGLFPGSASAGGLNVGSLFGGGGGFDLSSLFGASNFTAALAGDAFLPGALGAAGLGTAGAGSALGAGLAAAMPWALPVAMLAFAFLSSRRRGGPKTGGFASDIPGLDRFFTPSQRDTDLQAIVQAQQDAFQQMLTALGGTGTAGFAFGFDTDPEGTANDRIRAAVSANGQLLYDTGNIELGRDEAQTQAALELEAKRALLAALQASDLPQEIAALLDAVTPAGADAATIDNVLGVASALGSVYELFNSDVIEDGLQAYEDSIAGVDVAVSRAIDSVLQLAAEYDGTSDSALALAGATNEVYQASVQAIAQITQLRASIAEMFGSAATNYRLAGMTNAQQREYLQGQIASDTTALQSSTDVNEIARLAQRINQSQASLWGLLTPEEQFASANSFADAAEEAGAIVDGLLGDVLTGIEGAVTDMLTEVRDVLTDITRLQTDAAANLNTASSAQSAAADLQLAAANLQVSAAQTPITINLRGVPSEVGP